MPDIYTQTFATTVLDQLPAPLEGRMGTEKVELPVATGGKGISHESSSGAGGGSREEVMEAIWWVSVAGGVGVSLVVGFVVF